MKLEISLVELEDRPLDLAGEMPPEELDVSNVDELIQVRRPVTFQLLVQKLEDSVLVRGHVRTVLTCECARCLRPFEIVLDWPEWTVHLPLSGEDCVNPVEGVISLTPYLREDILLGFPQHPLCEPECGGLPGQQHRNGGSNEVTGKDAQDASSVWSALNQLKL